MRRKKIHFKLLVSFLFIFCSCNNPLHRTYNPATCEEDIQAIRESNKASDEDLQTLARFIVLARLSGNDISGKSYEDILDKIKTFQRNNDLLNSSDIIDKDAKRKRLSPFLEVNLQNKEFIKNNNKDILAFTVIFKNIGTQKIKVVTGNLIINDLLEKPVTSLALLLDQHISPGQKITKIYNVDYNDDDENDRRIRSKDLFEIRTVWDPEKIIFENGTIAQ